MQPERWQRIEKLCDEAGELDLTQRAAYLREACDGDADLRREVEELIAYQSRADGLFETSALHLAARHRASGEPILKDAAGTAIGRYRLLRKLGEGGMGEVWLAEQEEPVRRSVALKLVKDGMNTREVIARFESERQALALMDHPSIARVFDAGSTPDGAPYFVMEYVAGVPITAYCEDHGLNLRARLELFTRVCEGIQHAHQKAIIHRDLKPSNILVTEVDGQAAPKIIDFGIAKAVTRKLTAQTIRTHLGALVGTPEYMSPEQGKFSGDEIDTRTDVYSLGVIFYELLAGAPPIALKNVTLEEFLRRLREDEPLKPSTVVRMRTAQAELARERQAEARALVKQLHGDLDSIALKALEKDPARRYGSPSDFAADIARYLSNEAVLAVPYSTAYRARKFARRHRTGLVTACAFGLVLMVAIAITIGQSLRANREAAVAQAVITFLQDDLLAQTKPDPDFKVRTALDHAAAHVQGKFDQRPEAEAVIRDTIGQSYVRLGLYPEARKQLERALDLQRRVLGAQDPKTVRTISHLGNVAFLRGKYQQAEALLRQALDLQRRLLGLEHPDTLKSLNSLAGVYYGQRKYPQAEALFNQTMEICRRVFGPQHPDTLNCMHNLAAVYEVESKYAQAEEISRQALDGRRRVLGDEHPDTLASMNSLARVYFDLGKFAQAEKLDFQTLGIQRRVLGAGHPNTLRTMNHLATVYAAEGKYDLAERLGTETLEIRRRVFGPEHPTLTSMADLAQTYSAEGKYWQAEKLFSQTLEIQQRVLGPEHPDFLDTVSSLASLCQRQGRYALAETYAARALAGRRQALGDTDRHTMQSAADLALACLSQKKFTESEPLAREAFEYARKIRPGDWQRFRAESLLGASLAGQQKFAEAEPLMLEGYQGMLARQDRIAIPDRYHLDSARDWLAQLPQPVASYRPIITATAAGSTSRRSMR